MSERSNDGSPSTFRTGLMLALMFVLTVGLLGGVSSYMNMMEEGWGQHTCEEEYGPDAEYVSETSAFGGSGICNVDGEQKYVDVEYNGVLPP